MDKEKIEKPDWLSAHFPVSEWMWWQIKGVNPEFWRAA